MKYIVTRRQTLRYERVIQAGDCRDSLTVLNGMTDADWGPPTIEDDRTHIIETEFSNRNPADISAIPVLSRG